MKSSQNGVVLLVALMVFAVVATLSIQVLNYVEQSVAVVSRVQSDITVRHRLLAGEAWASTWLVQQLHASDRLTSPDTSRPWHLASREFVLQDVPIQVDMIDRQACINLNDLADANRTKAVQDRLLRLSSELSLSDEWVYLVKDWVDNDQVLSAAFSHEDEYYAGLQPAYRTADSPLADISELRLLPVPEQTWLRMMPYVCVLPQDSAININRLTPPLLRAYFPELTERKLQALEARIASAGFSSVEELINWPILADQALQTQDWCVQSSTFEVLITLKDGSHQRYLRTVLRQDEETDIVVPLSRSFVAFDVLSKALVNEQIRLPND
ncbi:Putative type II secretion system protein K [Marinomonas gallaica]|uniref:Type II secretion system protein K n=1 Tax=Marinomonas gallaica TaxID=1806667 RepID=A0A1C3JN17_9GAMM|nr:type II secretion system minor pseudopilin GspK [Marinomonas gallaica]SBT16544.1 Putative type II secretion system protein K [Marinomonas gallaica]SBT20260.1 Putative type II secretion system protein K [Marinomonas gallaica]